MKAETLETFAKEGTEVVIRVRSVVRGYELVGPPPSTGILTCIQIVVLLDQLKRDLSSGLAKAYEILAKVYKVAWDS